MTLIEQLEKLPRYDEDAKSSKESGELGWIAESKTGRVVLYDDLRAIIEQAKRESIGVMTEELKALLASVNGDYYLGKPMEEHLVSIVRKQYTAQQPDHTKLIGELVEALKMAEKCLVNSCMSHRNKVYPKPVERVRVANYCNRVITKAREAIK